MQTFSAFALIACYFDNGNYQYFAEFPFETEQSCLEMKPEFEKVADLRTILFCGLSNENT